MFHAPFAAFFVLLIIDSAHAQVSAPNCTVSNSNGSYEWSYNSLEQNPCLVAAYLAAMCNNGSQYTAFSILPLLPQYSYVGPDGQDNNDVCKCNTVTYNLISACDACQGETWISYSSWSYNCTSVAAPGTFPDSIPALTRVPLWAYFDLIAIGSDFWNESLAQSVGDSPEVTGSVTLNFPSSTSNVPSSTSDTTASQTILTEPATGSESISSPNSNSNSGAIAGGVVGAVTLIGGLVAWFTIRRRRQRRASSTDYISGQGGDTGVVPYPREIERPRLYYPSYPSTYPSRPTSTIHFSNPSGQHIGPSSSLQPNRMVYHGFPEI